MDTKKIVLIFIIGIIVIGGASLLIFQKSDKNSANPNPSSSRVLVTLPPVKAKILPEVVVTIDASGFTPSKVSITKDTVIKFDNKSGKDFEFSDASVKNMLIKGVLNKMTMPSPLLKEGSYTVVNKNNDSQKLEITVK